MFQNNDKHIVRNVVKNINMSCLFLVSGLKLKLRSCLALKNLVFSYIGPEHLLTLIKKEVSLRCVEAVIQFYFHTSQVQGVLQTIEIDLLLDRLYFCS